MLAWVGEDGRGNFFDGDKGWGDGFVWRDGDERNEGRI